CGRPGTTLVRRSPPISVDQSHRLPLMQPGAKGKGGVWFGRGGDGRVWRRQSAKPPFHWHRRTDDPERRRNDDDAAGRVLDPPIGAVVVGDGGNKRGHHATSRGARADAAAEAAAARAPTVAAIAAGTGSIAWSFPISRLAAPTAMSIAHPPS